MKVLLILGILALSAAPAFAETAGSGCAAARDPGRCEAQRAALQACAAKRGAEKRACLDASLPPVDCSKAQNPQRCESAQKAKEFCKTRTGKDLKKCLGDEKPKKKPHARRKSESRSN